MCKLICKAGSCTQECSLHVDACELQALLEECFQVAAAGIGPEEQVLLEDMDGFEIHELASQVTVHPDLLVPLLLSVTQSNTLWI